MGACGSLVRIGVGAVSAIGVAVAISSTLVVTAARTCGRWRLCVSSAGCREGVKAVAVVVVVVVVAWSTCTTTNVVAAMESFILIVIL